MEPRETSPRAVVVLVDDDPEILRSLGRFLRREPYELLSTESPQQVLEWASTRTIDLVIADQRMPEMFGTDLLGILRERSPGTKGVIVSGFPDAALIVERAGIRIERLIAKPWENTALKETIRELVEKTPKASPSALAAKEKPIQLRVDCAGMNVGLVLAEILPACRRAPSGARIRVTLDNLLLLRDSLARLLKDLARIVAYLNLPIEIRDTSGCVSAFLEAVGDCVRVP
jgi:response regulator RpfG family c-di-GMP phosphodiesterase